MLIIHFGCSKDEPEEIDTESPVLNCPDDVVLTIESYENSIVVTYETPKGVDNFGSNTTQIEGLASGESFPEGTTTNTFKATDIAGNSTICSFNVIITKNAANDNVPYFIDENPTPANKKWTKVENLSDEFNTDELDETKWKNTDPNKWIGRAPGLFKKNTVSQSEGSLKLTADILPSPEVVNGNTFTHAGSNITSINSIRVGHYFEARMKSSKTFMSSTFWLINDRNDASGCDKRTTELDIQECVGQITSTESWTADKDEEMGSNTHSRNTSCTTTPEGSVGDHVNIGGKAYDDYHVYAAWWKSATEIDFYLDGKKVYTVTPKAEFNLQMYLRLVVETYDWNPVPSDGGMTGSFEDRSTSYDWVRTWKLEDN
ncbi:hypothetical protein BW723_04065 [Polaribacter reichenbachii]|nr:hypothetical protein BW723_04065 [Polaribacter reichenbachii]AUC19382.1 hypothetical protein BTO17_12070 [Polaribacter reichenbachii]